MQLVFATANKNKALEIGKLLPPEIKVLTLLDIHITEEIPETAGTIEGNALQKAKYVFIRSGINCFADDTGLEVEALNGAPGVDTAYYGGPQKNADDNMNKLILELKNKVNRKAQFKTIIALVINGEEYVFEGIIKGEIAREKRGEKGFGYDPVFIPEGHSRTFAEMETDEKNHISHRAIATQKLIRFLNRVPN